MQYQLNSPEEKEEFAKQMVDYMAKNNIKSPKTETYDELYYKLLNDLKSKKNINKINIQGMDDFKYTPVNKKAALGDSIKEGWKAFKDYSRENQWVQPTLQGAAGAGIGALIGLLMGPKRRALKVLLSTLGGAGIGVGTGFATNYALKPKIQTIEQIRKKFEDDAARDELSYWTNVRYRPSDVNLALGVVGTHKELTDMQAGRIPFSYKRFLQLNSQLNDLYAKGRGDNVIYNLTHPDMSQDKVWKAKKHLIRKIDDTKSNQRTQNVIRHIKAGTDYLLNRQYKR